MMGDLVIKAEGISKKYCRTIKHTMLYGATDLSKSFLGINQNTNHLRNGEFWAVDNLSFELKRGECLGVIGPNGSGKSTLLKMINGIFMPDRGKIEINGRVGALIEIGAGFHPMLTGRENVYVNGSILGLSKKEIDRKFDDILDFAEIGEFIDAPVKHYSSGMHVRLGFAIAAQMEPDVMLIDEVLAVGDIGFRDKCFNAMARILKNAAVIFVSHAMPLVARISSRVCVMNHGNAVYQGRDVPKGIHNYYSNFEVATGIIAGNGRAVIHNIDFESKGEKGIEQLNYLDDLTVHLDLTVDPEVKYPSVAIGFISQELQTVALCYSLFDKIRIHNAGEHMNLALKLPEVCLSPGAYMLLVHITDERRVEVFAEHYAVKKLKIIGDFVTSAPVQLAGNWYINKTMLHKTGDL